MITVSIAGGSQPEILQLVKKALKEAEQPLQFIVFDTNENLDTENLWKYVHCSDDATVAACRRNLLVNRLCDEYRSHSSDPH